MKNSALIYKKVGWDKIINIMISLKKKLDHNGIMAAPGGGALFEK